MYKRMVMMNTMTQYLLTSWHASYTIVSFPRWKLHTMFAYMTWCDVTTWKRIPHCRPLFATDLPNDDVIKCKHFPRYWPVVMAIRQSPVKSPHNGPVMRTLKFLWCGPAYAVKQTFELPVIWDYMTFLWRHRNELPVYMREKSFWNLTCAIVPFPIFIWSECDNSNSSYSMRL